MQAKRRPGWAWATAAVAIVQVAASACGHPSAGARKAVEAATVRSQQARDLARQAGLGPDVQAFVARAAGAGAASFTVVYDLGNGRRAVVMQRPPSRRVDVEGVSGPATIDRYLLVPSGTYSCHNDRRAWSCQRGGDAPSIGAFSPDTIGPTVAALSQSTGAYDFAIQSRHIAGIAASCLVTTLKPDHPPDPALGARGALCIAPSGAILSVEGTPANAVNAVSYATSVPGHAFALPARPAAGP